MAASGAERVLRGAGLAGAKASRTPCLDAPQDARTHLNVHDTLQTIAAMPLHRLASRWRRTRLTACVSDRSADRLVQPLHRLRCATASVSRRAATGRAVAGKNSGHDARRTARPR
ncbi:hypothetical protein, partial [Xanthomonas citri]|uniref:hypothetical protein n=2 Tax=Xanthomonas citri TaxID=346 RepID=UPI001F3DB727